VPGHQLLRRPWTSVRGLLTTISRVIGLRSVALALVPLLVVVGCGGAAKKPNAGPTTPAGPCNYRDDGSEPSKPVQAPPATPDPSNPASMVLSTSAGDIRITFEPDTAPCAVNSFVNLARQNYFTDTNCHRLTTQGYYVLQCGDPDGTGQGGPGYSFADELVTHDPRLEPCGDVQGQAYCTYSTGTVAMANRGPDTNGSQFFLVYGSSRFPPDFTVFGHLDAAGLKVVKKVAAKGIGTPSGMGPGDGTPKVPVTITGVK
jgi:peptidyl-prolyl cis-trans isomerase B (cyclophilin B)